MKKVGYLEGTDPNYLTHLAILGVDTLPLGNGADNHGKYVGFINKSDGINLVITHYHKIVPLSEQESSPQELLQACKLNHVKVLVIVPKELQEKARAAMKGVTAEYRFVDPGDVMTEIKETLGVR